MDKIIHVLNGDSTVQLLKDSGIKGEVAVWREMLCEGPLHSDFGSDEFWLKRNAYFENEFGIDKLEYFDKTIKEILKLKELSKYKEVVLWFEFDLFCQINLIATCSYLLKYFKKDVKLSLVCVGKVKEKEELQSLSDFSPQEFKGLYKNKLNLSKTNLIFADECWKLYVENNFEKLKEFNFKNLKFQYLQQAINQHLKRFSFGNKLNQIQHKILSIINENEFSKKEIVKELLTWQHKETVYGFGDLQYFQYLKKLNTNFDIKQSKYHLNQEGIQKLKANEL